MAYPRELFTSQQIRAKRAPLRDGLPGICDSSLGLPGLTTGISVQGLVYTATPAAGLISSVLLCWLRTDSPPMDARYAATEYGKAWRVIVLDVVTPHYVQADAEPHPTVAPIVSAW